MLYIYIFGTIARSEHSWCSGSMKDFHSFDPGSIPGGCKFFWKKKEEKEKKE